MSINLIFSQPNGEVTNSMIVGLRGILFDLY